MKMKGIAYICLGMISTQLNATVIFDDGGTHTINSLIYDNVILENYSDLNIVGGGLVITPGSDPAVYVPTSSTGNSGSTINMNGNATVIGGIRMRSTDNIASSVVTREDSIVVGQGVYSNGVGRAAISGAHHVEINDNSRIVGATSETRGGAAIENGDSGHYHVTVNGGEIVGGQGEHAGGYGIDPSYDPVHLEITGGVVRGGYGEVNGGIGAINVNHGDAVMTGGAIYGGDGGVNGGDAFYSNDDLYMDIYGGYLQGGTGGSNGGSAISIIQAEPANIRIFGGHFDAGLGGLDDGWVFDLRGSGIHISLYGGQIGYSTNGSGISIDSGIVDVYGWDLKLEDDLLTGYLLDGNWIETPITVASRTQPDRGLRLFNHENVNVPEPSVLLLMATGLVGVGFSRLKKTQFNITI
ncbi:MAG: PEP-CTERM sorting domain-containing protein [Candidatus Thiodiazotropha sp.]